MFTRDNNYFFVNDLKISFGIVELNQESKSAIVTLPFSYASMNSYSVFVSETTDSSIARAYIKSLNSFYVSSTLKSGGVFYLTIGYWLKKFN